MLFNFLVGFGATGLIMERLVGPVLALPIAVAGGVAFEALVVRPIFKDTAPVRFEGNNYSEEWVKEAGKRGLPNLRRSPEAH